MAIPPLSGYDGAASAVADGPEPPLQAGVRPENLFFTAALRRALIAVLRALAVPEAEVIAIAPFFPEYRPFAEATGGNLVVVPPIWRISRSILRPWPRP